ncbi:MAG: hypothetical protein PHD43_20320 [Methylococcales bacterium]|nr:hypothetical protein [Methylococcales bacterium]
MSTGTQNHTHTHTQTRDKSLAEFYSAPDTSLFNQIIIAHIRDCSTATMERDRWAGGGIPFIKIGRAVKYCKADVLEWLAQYQLQNSTSEGVAE